MAGEHQAKQVNMAVAEGGAYEVIRKRLLEQSAALENRIKQINDARLREFGSSDMKVAARVRVRTENNCVARDIVQVGPWLLFGYNVFIGLKKETHVEDVFAAFELVVSEDGIKLESVKAVDTFLSDARFHKDFTELYRYYKQTRLLELTVKNGRLLMGFQIGEKADDIRVFRWAVSADGRKVEYIDNRGERDIQLPPAYDFEWIRVTRENTVNGKYPHVNILDKVFVETTHGDLTIKVENNTESGFGIYSEPVEEPTQSIDDADYQYAALGDVILLKILPYKEEQYRYFVFNTLTHDVRRFDAIGGACVQLPEDHGVIFPGGYYLQTGESKIFDDNCTNLKFKRSIKSPNGEDVLYVFYEPAEGVVGLFAYNMINKSLQNPIFGHGYALRDDGKIIIFSAESEPTRVHPMQIWETPYFSDEYASTRPASQSFYGRIGNAELVRGISDILSVVRMVKNQSVSSRLYEELNRASLKIFDDHYWVGESETAEIKSLLTNISETANQAIDEFEKVKSIQGQSAKALQDAEEHQKKLVTRIRTASWETVEEYVTALDGVRKQRGHLSTIKEYRYIDHEKIQALDEELVKVQEQLSGKTVDFLAGENALTPYHEKIVELDREVDNAGTIAGLNPVVENLEKIALGLDLLSELLASLSVEDTTLQTRIVDSISEIYGKLNQSKAQARHKQKSLGSEEATAQFAARFKLLSQSVTNALGLASSPEACDEQMSRLLVQLEELESEFSEHEEFLADIMEKREEVYDAFETHKQQLIDDRQRRAQGIADAAARVLNSIEKRSTRFADADSLNTYFASDPLVLKVGQFVSQLHKLNASVSAEDINAKFKGIKEQALRILRDKTDIYEDDGNVIKLGPRHKFSVNTQELDLSIIPRQDQLYIHLSGTDFYERITDPEMESLKPWWNVSIESESDEVYRAEYLAASILWSAERGENNLSMQQLRLDAADETALIKTCRDFAAPRYKEGYEKGIHDHDAAKILHRFIPVYSSAGLLRFDPLSRGFAQVFWANIKKISDELKSKRLTYETWIERAQSAAQMEELLASRDAEVLLAEEVYAAMKEFITTHPFDIDDLVIKRAADYLVDELGRERPEFVGSKYARLLADELKRSLSDENWRQFRTVLEKMQGWPAERWKLSCAWLKAMMKERKLLNLERYIPEAAALINADERIARRASEVDLEIQVEGLLGEHKRISGRKLHISIDEFLLRLDKHDNEFIPEYHRYQKLRQKLAETQKNKLRLNEFKARPLSSFVRNKLINEAYLPVIGDNLAKQMGTTGDKKRTDLMGLLMMISPPGYGKTTLMEYVASRLGLIFMKINCPALGHDVLSLDPEQAPNATARQELNKLNLGLEMGSNVMLYLDDIQHTHPEFLQKFISLCDGTRRIEGVWRGQTKTYDMRGKKFCVVMAGNPYTESGEVFKIPDMLANRADIYNLGDILGGMDEAFALSYIENSLTSNSVLAPLATRDMNDVYRFVRMAKGEDVATTDLSHQYSGAEVSEIREVLKKLFVVRDVILKINQQYIASAAQADKYRTEPPFKLQGSYRNMNKMAEKISAIMNERELMQLIEDHYLGEAQLLTSGAEENLLKLAELRGNMTVAQRERWDQIKKDFMRVKAMGGDEADTGSKIVAQLVDLTEGINGIAGAAHAFGQSSLSNDKTEQYAGQAATIARSLDSLKEAITGSQPKVEVINQPVPGVDKILRVLANTIEDTIFPLVRSMDKKLEIDLRTHEKMSEVSNQLRLLESEIRSGQFQTGKAGSKDKAAPVKKKPSPKTEKD